jgi:transcription initiation factor TFIID subunit TAF12
MFRRRPIVAPRRGPGLVGTMARTAVVAGTATAVSRGVSGSMDARAQAQQQQQAAQDAAFQAQADIAQLQGQLAAMQAQAAPPAASPDLLSQLQQLAQLKKAGMLTDAEFETAKARLLGG